MINDQFFNMNNEIQIIGYYFHVKIDFYFEFLMPPFVFHFHKKIENLILFIFCFLFS